MSIYRNMLLALGVLIFLLVGFISQSNAQSRDVTFRQFPAPTGLATNFGDIRIILGDQSFCRIQGRDQDALNPAECVIRARVGLNRVRVQFVGTNPGGQVFAPVQVIEFWINVTSASGQVVDIPMREVTFIRDELTASVQKLAVSSLPSATVIPNGDSTEPSSNGQNSGIQFLQFENLSKNNESSFERTIRMLGGCYTLMYVDRELCPSTVRNACKFKLNPQPVCIGGDSPTTIVINIDDEP